MSFRSGIICVCVAGLGALISSAGLAEVFTIELDGVANTLDLNESPAVATVVDQGIYEVTLSTTYNYALGHAYADCDKVVLVATTNGDRRGHVWVVTAGEPLTIDLFDSQTPNVITLYAFLPEGGNAGDNTGSATISLTGPSSHDIELSGTANTLDLSASPGIATTIAQDTYYVSISTSYNYALGYGFAHCDKVLLFATTNGNPTGHVWVITAGEPVVIELTDSQIPDEITFHAFLPEGGNPNDNQGAATLSLITQYEVALDGVANTQNLGTSPAVATTVTQGTYAVTLDTDYNYALGYGFADCDKAVLYATTNGDPTGHVWVVTEGETLTIELTDSQMPDIITVHAFLPEGGNAGDNTGSATVSLNGPSSYEIELSGIHNALDLSTAGAVATTVAQGVHYVSLSSTYNYALGYGFANCDKALLFATTNGNPTGHVWVVTEGEDLVLELTDSQTPDEITFHAMLPEGGNAGDNTGVAVLTFLGTAALQEVTEEASAVSVAACGAVLNPCRPNPFNPSTTISFDLRDPSAVSLRIYDVQGRIVRTLLDRRLGRDSHAVVWNGRDDSGRTVATGVYFYHLQAGAESQARKMTLAK